MNGTTISCIVTKEEKYFSSTALKSKLDKFGTIENVQKYYVSRPAAKLLKSGCTIDQVREKLNSKSTNQVDFEVLYKLKLLKTGKKRKKYLSSMEQEALKLQTQKNERDWYEHQEKMKDCQKTWIQEMTGGKNGCQIPNGGTCIRPDIYYNHEFDKTGRCTPCPYHEHCLCRSKELK